MCRGVRCIFCPFFQCIFARKFSAKGQNGRIIKPVLESFYLSNVKSLWWNMIVIWECFCQTIHQEEERYLVFCKCKLYLGIEMFFFFFHSGHLNLLFSKILYTEKQEYQLPDNFHPKPCFKLSGNLWQVYCGKTCQNICWFAGKTKSKSIFYLRSGKALITWLNSCPWASCIFIAYKEN